MMENGNPTPWYQSLVSDFYLQSQAFLLLRFRYAQSLMSYP